MKNQKKHRRLIILLFALSIIPFLIAWYLNYNPQWLGGRTNRGDLIIPPVPTQRTELKGFDEFSKSNINELEGHWVMLHLIPGQECNEVCSDALYKSKQLLVMMGKDLTRIRRGVILMSEVSEAKAEKWWQDDSRLIRLKAEKSMLVHLQGILKQNKPTGILIIMDPLGNLMMMYKTGFDPYDVKRDLKKLLNISQIG